MIWYIKLKIRKVPLHTLEHTEIEAVMREVELRAMEPGIVFGKRSMVSSFFGSISDTKVIIFPARGRQSSGALDGVFVCEQLCAMTLQDYSDCCNDILKSLQPTHRHIMTKMKLLSSNTVHGMILSSFLLSDLILSKPDR